VRLASEGSKIPVVFAFVVAPLETGVVDDLTHPSGNITGVRNPVDVFVGKRVEYLLKIAPNVKRLWVPNNPAYPTVTAVLNALRQSAPTLGMELVETPISAPADVITALQGYDQAGDPPFDAILILPDLTLQGQDAWTAILTYATAHKLPISANTEAQVEQGALFSYLSDNAATGRQAAQQARQIFQGTKTSDLPVETADVFLTINLKVAEQMGLTIPDALLGTDTKIIR
jgi:putative tryptophan/tyrosine transport system substrate-binding protein